MGAGALFRDACGRILLVNPTYKDTWEIPGGAIEAGESPRSCCRREVMEELGLDLPIGRLLVVDWLPADPPRPDGLMFAYDGGVMDEAVTSKISLPADELSEWRFVDVAELDSFLPPHRARRHRIAHACALNGTTLDLEWGYEPGAP